MPLDTNYDKPEPTRAEVDALTGPTVLEFGATWCEFCRGAQPAIAAALADHLGVRHVKVGDGKGKPLGRSFGVKLWPTLVFLKDGKEVSRAVRPTDEEFEDEPEIRRFLRSSLEVVMRLVVPSGQRCCRCYAGSRPSGRSSSRSTTCNGSTGRRLQCSSSPCVGSRTRASE